MRYREELQMGRVHWGLVIFRNRANSLWMDLLLLSFSYMSIPDGSYFWLWWVLAEAVFGRAMVIAGNLYRSNVVESEP